jgi:hypothetical protein
MSGDDNVGKDDPMYDIPSSMPWENTPPDGWGDVWPETQLTSPTRRSQTKSSQSGSGQFNDGFRVPDPPSVHKTSLNNSNDSQRSRTSSQLSLSPRHLPRDLFAPMATHHSQNPSIPDSQDLTQSQESPRIVPVDDDLTQSQEDYVPTPRPAEKRKREPSIYDLTDSPTSYITMTDETPKRPRQDFDFSSDSLQEVTESQIPEGMRKKPIPVVNIHSTQSQSQEYIAPTLPGPTSQDLTEPFNYHSQASSTSSDAGWTQHDWKTSQVTASPLPSQLDLQSLVSPPPQILSSQIDASNTKEPLSLTLGTMFPLRTEADDLPDIAEVEKKTWKEFDENEERIAKTPRARRK